MYYTFTTTAVFKKPLNNNNYANMQFLKSVQLKTTFLLPFLFDIYKKLNNLPVSAQSTTTRTVTYYFPTLYFFNYSILYVHNSHYIKKQIRYIDYLNLRYRFFLKVPQTLNHIFLCRNFSICLWFELFPYIRVGRTFAIRFFKGWTLVICFLGRTFAICFVRPLPSVFQGGPLPFVLLRLDLCRRFLMIRILSSVLGWNYCHLLYCCHISFYLRICFKVTLPSVLAFRLDL